MLIPRTQDFMTGVPAIPGKHLSIELVSKMVCLEFCRENTELTFPGQRNWYCAGHIQGALRPYQQTSWNHLLGIKLHKLWWFGPEPTLHIPWPGLHYKISPSDFMYFALCPDE